jgi:FixJ family two-component response regulator
MRTSAESLSRMMASKMADSPHQSVAAGEIFIVDDDPGVRATLTTIFERAGYRVVAFADGASFLAHARTATPVSIILDVHIPGRTGLDILRELHAQDYPAPIFIVSGQGDIPMAVDAIKAGALDFIEKPFRGSEVVERVKQAISAYSLRKQDDPGLPELFFPGREPLTRREREVLATILKGASAKEAGRQLGISHRTIEVHRAKLMEKFGARNVTDLMRIVFDQGQRR